MNNRKDDKNKNRHRILDSVPNRPSIRRCGPYFEICDGYCSGCLKDRSITTTNVLLDQLLNSRITDNDVPKAYYGR